MKKGPARGAVAALAAVVAGNVVVEAHLHCVGACPADLGAAARASFDAVDAAARAAS